MQDLVYCLKKVKKLMILEVSLQEQNIKINMIEIH